MVRIAARWLVVCSSLFSLFSKPVAAESVDDAGLWTAVFGQGDFTPVACPDSNLRWWFDGQLRFLDDADGLNPTLVRPGLGWSVTERSTLWAGYAWIHNEPITGESFEENRVWEQWTWSREIHDLKISHRSRFEQRFLETGSDTGLRFREMVRGERKLPHAPNMSFVLWDEIFYNCNDTDWGAEAGFDQNRAFIGLGFQTDPNCRWRTEIGYLNQAIQVPTGDDRVNHILSLSFFWR